MTFEIYLKKELGNDIAQYVDVGKMFAVTTLNITDGLLKKGAYQIPIEHVLFIKEV